jgi:cytochrome b561
MQIKSSVDRYGAVAIVIHWTAAAIILALLISGFRAANLTDAALKAGVLRFHVVGGLLVLLLTLARVAWWAFADRKPLPVAGASSLQNGLARLVHILFYIVVLGMAASGIGMMALSGAGATLFGDAGGVLPNFTKFLPRVPHGLGGRFMVALFVLHTAGALYHQFILRDRLFARMGIGA